jgi:hypothetical protein
MWFEYLLFDIVIAEDGDDSLLERGEEDELDCSAVVTCPLAVRLSASSRREREIL